MNKLCVILFFIPAIAFCQKKWKVEDCIKYAIENNLQLKNGTQDIKAKKNAVKQAKYNFLPTFEISASNGYNFGQSIDPFTNEFASERVLFSNFYSRSSINLFSGLLNYYALGQAETEVSLAEASKMLGIRDIKIEVLSNFLQILLNKEQVKFYQQQIDYSIRSRDKMKELVELGVFPESNILKAEARISSDELNLVRFTNKVKLFNQKLRRLLNISESDSFEIDTNTIYELPMDSYTGGSIEARIADLEMELMKIQLKVEKSKMLPSISLTGSLGSGYSGNNTEYINDDFVAKPFQDQFNENLYQSLSLNLSIPIFSNFQTRTSIKNVQIGLEKSKNNYEEKLIEFKFQMERLKLEIETLKVELESQKKMFKLQEELFLISLESYKLGKEDFNHLSEVKLTLEKAKSDVLTLEYSIKFKLIMLSIFKQ